jgi:hypothetical protein
MGDGLRNGGDGLALSFAASDQSAADLIFK